jgi:hypothetical protein
VDEAIAAAIYARTSPQGTADALMRTIVGYQALCGIWTVTQIDLAQNSVTLATTLSVTSKYILRVICMVLQRYFHNPVVVS